MVLADLLEQVDFFADGIFAGEVLAHERLVYDCSIVRRVGVGEQPAADQRNSQRLEIRRTDVTVGQFIAAMGGLGKGAVFAGESVPVDPSIWGERIAEGDGGNGGKGRERAADVRDGTRRGDVRNDDALGLETDVLMLQPPEALEHQGGDDQQCKRQSHFRGDEKSARAGAGETLHRSRCGEGGGEPEYDSRRQCGKQREDEYSQVHGYLSNAWEISRGYCTQDPYRGDGK